MPSSESLAPFLIGERLGNSVWAAEDTRNGKRVAVKLLSRQLPKEQAKRDALLRDVRVSAALYHTFLVPVLEIVAVDENLLMVMELVDAEPIGRRLRGQPLGREELFRLAYQLASVVKYLHIKELIHGNINGHSVMVTPEGRVVLGGLQLGNLLRRDRSSMSYQQKGTDTRSVAYMAPEQIASKGFDERTDVFSIGVVLYEMATGKVPFSGQSAADIARAVVDAQPPSPKTVNPEISPAAMQILAGCLFKDPFSRFKDVKALCEAIERADGNAVQFAAQMEKKVTTAASPESEHRRSILFIADVADYDALAAEDPEPASKAAARMQQILGEAVYLFEGQVVDPFGTRFIAELPSVESALEAGRKAEFDLSPRQQESNPLRVRMLLHAGDYELREGAAAGPAVERALATLTHLPPNSLFISEELVKEGRGSVRLRDAGAHAGVKLYTIVEPAPLTAATDDRTPTDELDEDDPAVTAEVEAIVQSAQRRMRHVAAAAAVAVVVLGGAVTMWLRQGAAERLPVTTVAAVTQSPAAPTAQSPRKIAIAPFTIETADPEVADRAHAIRLGAIEILRSFPELRIVDEPDAGAASFSARIRDGEQAAEIVVTADAKHAAAVPITEVATGIRAVVQFVVEEVGARPRVHADVAAVGAFADAVVARSLNDTKRADASLRAALAADPDFLPTQLLAMEFFAATGRNDDALAAAKEVVTLDPANLDAARRVARASLIAGDIRQAFALYDLVLTREPRDIEALNHVARYAAAVGDAAKFRAALARLKGAPTLQVNVHEPDLIAAAGRIDAAIQRYYAFEETAADSPALALKIGRLAVLRHSVPIAEVQLEKLAQSDPLYGYHMLSAYIAAEKKDRGAAKRELEKALAVAVPGDDSSTSAAEVHAILADTDGVIAALEKAAKRKEPTAAYVLAHPLFRYLESDPRFQKLRARLEEQQGEIRAALDAVPVG